MTGLDPDNPVVELFRQAWAARRFYDLAAGQLEAAPGGRYGDLVRGGIEKGRRRVSGDRAQM